MGGIRLQVGLRQYAQGNHPSHEVANMTGITVGRQRRWKQTKPRSDGRSRSIASLIRESVIAFRLRYCNCKTHAFAATQSPPRFVGASEIVESASVDMTYEILVRQSTNGTLVALVVDDRFVVMKIAIPTFATRVSPRFDSARSRAFGMARKRLPPSGQGPVKFPFTP